MRSIQANSSMRPAPMRHFCLPLALVLLAASSLACAQARTDAGGTRITEPATAASRWQGDRDALDQVLRARVAAASTPRELWIEGTLADADPWAGARALAEARTRVPSEKLFLASLAMACLAPLQ